MDRGVWKATVHRVARVGHDLVTTPPPPLLDGVSSMATGRQAPQGFSVAMQNYSTQNMHLALLLVLRWHVSYKKLIGT